MGREGAPGWTAVSACRACGHSPLDGVLALGPVPVADHLPTPEEHARGDPRLPLTLVLCPACALAQLAESVAPEALFDERYPYFSSVSPALRAHFAASAEDIARRRRLDGGSLVVEAASNDGAMLRNFVARGVPVLGVDPAPRQARAAEDAGVRTIGAFFTRELAERLSREAGRADVFLASNVLAHVPDLCGFVDGIGAILKEDGIAVIEVPYVVELVDRLEFDTIYHQHHCYFSVTSLDRLFAARGLFLNDVLRTPIHGGSLRLLVGRRPEVEPAVGETLREEARRGVDGPRFYGGFAAAVAGLRKRLRTLLAGIRGQGGRIAGYGAAAKAATLLGHCGIGRETLEYVVDLNPVKHGRVLAGSGIAILPVERLERDPPDYLLLLAWNFAEEIMAAQERFRRAGGRFILPLPEPRVV